MSKAPESLLQILPVSWRTAAAEQAPEGLQEIHLRMGQPPLLQGKRETVRLKGLIREEDLTYCMNLASRYSPWNAATAASGFLTAPGGHRIGLCGEASPGGFRKITSVCIRVSRDLPGISRQIPLGEDLLILGPPGSGKTTLLRDLIRRISSTECATVAVVDERCELFPLFDGKPAYDPGPNTDVLLGRRKPEGLDMVLRAMGPKWIAVDEITDSSDCVALSQAAWCGVHLVATAHAGSVEDFLSRPVYGPLVHTGLFRTAVVLHPDKSYHAERIPL